jgi:hypothetical protein
VGSIRNWEVGRRIRFEFVGPVYDFIVICPYDTSLSLAGRLRERPEYLGFSIMALAHMLGSEPSTVGFGIGATIPDQGAARRDLRLPSDERFLVD